MLRLIKSILKHVYRELQGENMQGDEGCTHILLPFGSNDWVVQLNLCN